MQAVLFLKCDNEMQCFILSILLMVYEQRKMIDLIRLLVIHSHEVIRGGAMADDSAPTGIPQGWLPSIMSGNGTASINSGCCCIIVQSERCVSP
jgi:hypothetical protein